MFDPKTILYMVATFGLELAKEKLEEVRKRSREADSREMTENLLANYSEIARCGYLTDLLTKYYSAQELKRAGLSPYRLVVGKTKVSTTIATKNEWSGVSIELGANSSSETCELAHDVPEIEPPDPKAVVDALHDISTLGICVWDAPIYRLVHADVTGDALSVRFALDRFLSHRFTTGSLFVESAQALIDTNFDIKKALSLKAEKLSRREKLLPTGRSLLRFDNRVCAGGVATVFALAREKPMDFVIPLQKRSMSVSGAPGMRSVIPKAFHQPMVDSAAETRLSHTVYRELFEELFSGGETERKVRRLKHDWFLEECEPLKWLVDNESEKDSFELVCTSFGIDLVYGNYEFAILLCIQNPEYWNIFGHLLVTNWEASEVDTLLVSTADSDLLSGIISKRDWTGDSLVSFVEGLKQLKKLDPKRVNLPDMETVL